MAATAGAALVVVPLTGAAAAALVSQDVTAVSGTSEVALEADAASADLGSVAASVTAPDELDYDVATPDIDVSEDPEPVVIPETTSSDDSSDSSSSRLVVEQARRARCRTRHRSPQRSPALP
ncbi:hypothetical protein GCM10025876_12960 [Demequina litorisediminis]|uniref:Secreted protein n=1 Tax=Demequina litorisediminis TaxID=1849022 RepID=A0ABQ6IDL8_9MICO|nr:hypothetical protein GCM10025876_12960 [Demequina litorisediminis]